MEKLASTGLPLVVIPFADMAYMDGDMRKTPCTGTVRVYVGEDSRAELMREVDV